MFYCLAPVFEMHMLQLFFTILQLINPPLILGILFDNTQERYRFVNACMRQKSSKIKGLWGGLLFTCLLLSAFHNDLKH